MKISNKEKQIQDFASIYEVKYGVDMDLQYTRLSSRERAFVCLIKSALIFLCVYGSAGLFLTSFGLPSIQWLLFLFILAISVIAGMLYYNRLVFNIGYILFFILICFLAYSLYWYANSGMNAILNSALKIIDEKLNLHGVREYNEVIKDRRVTVSCCIILISCLMVCLYNSAISGYMSPLFTFVLLYPIAQFCVYFDDEVNYFYLGMMILAFLGVVLFRVSGRYYMPYRGVAPNLRIKGETVTHESEMFLKTLTHLSVIAAVLLLVLMLLAGTLVSASPRRYKNNYSTWKTGTDALVKEFALNGILGFFNHYSANGGLSEGRLGGIRQVMLTFDPQLEVKIVPDNVNGIYLRGYIGEYYDDNQWHRIPDKERTMYRQYGIMDTEAIVNQESSILKELYDSGQNPYSAQAYMTVKTLDTLDYYRYTPYYSVVDYSDTAEINSSSFDDHGDYVMYNVRTKSLELKHQYYPYDLLREQLADNSIELPGNTEELRYRMFVYDNYLYIPRDIREDLQEICNEHITGSDRETVVEQILEYFTSEFKYTLSPGITPSKRDFVVYFLSQQKKGFCAHFATAAAMLLRSKGIPARYVEGYYIQFTDATNVEVDEFADVNEWYDGYNGTVEGDEEPSLITVNARGADAHAWVEIYYDGFGWIPVEFTVAESEESEEGGSFWDRFGGFFGSNESGNSPVDNVTEQLQNAAPFVFGTVGVAFGAFLILVCFFVIRRKYRLYFKKSNSRLVTQYTTLSKILRKTGLAVEQNNIFHNTMKHYMTSVLELDASDVEEYVSLVEKASFGNEALSADELAKATACFKSALHKAKTLVSRSKRVSIVLST